MSERSPVLLLEDMLEAIRRIEAYTAGMTLEMFLADQRTQDAVARNFELIGEAASRLPLQFRQAHAQVDWRTIIAFRNRLIHAYFGIDFHIVWNVVQNHLPHLKLQLEDLYRRLS